MAKADKKKAGTRSKLPKRIAGTKVPKALRKSGARAMKWAMSSTGREILGGLLVAAAATITSNKKARGVVGEGAKDAASGASRVGQALAGAAVEVVRRAVGGESDAQASPATTAEPAVKRGKPRPGTPTFTH
jgi:hypothetical protein